MPRSRAQAIIKAVQRHGEIAFDPCKPDAHGVTPLAIACDEDDRISASIVSFLRPEYTRCSVCVCSAVCVCECVSNGWISQYGLVGAAVLSAANRNYERCRQPRWCRSKKKWMTAKDLIKLAQSCPTTIAS